jgi:hypothetical protein
MTTPASHVPLTIRLLAAACAILAIAPFAATQNTGNQAVATATAPTPVYAPTSLMAEPGLPRTSFGRPSFEGIWTTNFLLPLQASPLAPTLTLPEDEARKVADQIISQQLNSPFFALDPETPGLLRNLDGFAIVRGERRTRALVDPPDGRLPFTPTARQEIQAALPKELSRPADNPEERTGWERCLAMMGQPPLAAMGSTNPRQIIQTRDYVVFHTEYGGEARIIPFTSMHRPETLRSGLGDSIARWEGDTLVIETIRIPPGDRLRLIPTMIVPATGKIMERLTRISRDELLYQYTIEDGSVYAKPWLAEYSLFRTDQRLFEFACHEGNYALANILSGQRASDSRMKPKR